MTKLNFNQIRLNEQHKYSPRLLMYLWSLSLYGLSLLLLSSRSKTKYVNLKKKKKKKNQIICLTVRTDLQLTSETPPQPQSLPPPGEMLLHPSPNQPAEEVGSGSAVNVPLYERNISRLN